MFFELFFIPTVIGRCLWVSSIQQGAKLRSLTTPSDEAFCLLVLKNNWDLWTWECHNPDATVIYKIDNAPKVLFTSAGKGKQTETYGGWNKEGISLYNDLVEELTMIRKKLDLETINMGNGVKKRKMEFIEEAYIHWAMIWDTKNVLNLNRTKSIKMKKIYDVVQAVQIFGWKDNSV